MFRSLCMLVCLAIALPVWAQDGKGYYRFPAIHGDTIVFAAEGDLWRVPLAGGLAQRLTTHPGEETAPIISPDGQTVAFSGTYEGGTEIYTMPLAGGLPTRWTARSSPATIRSFASACDRFNRFPSGPRSSWSCAAFAPRCSRISPARTRASLRGDRCSTCRWAASRSAASSCPRSKHGR